MREETIEKWAKSAELNERETAHVQYTNLEDIEVKINARITELRKQQQRE